MTAPDYRHRPHRAPKSHPTKSTLNGKSCGVVGQVGSGLTAWISVAGSRHLRERLQLSETAFAARLGVSTKTLQRLNGRVAPRLALQQGDRLYR